MTDTLQSQVALVTGASSGIGRAAALRLAASGVSVGLLARSRDALTEVGDAVRREGGQAIELPADVTHRAAVEAVVRRIEETLGPISLLVNSAGITLSGAFWEVDPDDWWRVMEVNMRGPMLCTHAVLPGMLARSAGRIINVNSYAGVRVRPRSTAYAASKAALSRFTDSLAESVRPHGIGVFGISPGWVHTPMSEAEWQETVAGTGAMTLADWTPIERPVDLILLIASGKLDALTGRLVHVNDDHEEMMRRAQEIRDRNLYVLRLPTLRGLVE